MGRLREWDDAYGPAAKLRVALLLDARKEAIEVEIEPFNFVGVTHDPLPRGNEKNITRTFESMAVGSRSAAKDKKPCKIKELFVN